jgi:signal transduction histidine kinase
VLRYGGPLRAAWAAASILALAVALALTVRDRPVDTAATLRLMSAAVWIGCGCLVVLRAARSAIVTLTACTLLADGLAPVVSAATDGRPGAWTGWSATAVALSLTVLTLSRFPDGRFVPGWLRWLCVAFAAWEAGTVVTGPVTGGWDVVGGVVFFAAIGVPAVAQVRRHRRLRDPQMRMRTTWFVYGLCVAFGIELVTSAPYFVPGWSGDLIAVGSPYDRFQDVAGTLGLLAIPVCLALAMVASRLFDVDVVVSRTLVYAGLTLAVTLGYLGVVSGLGLLVGRHGDAFPPLVGAAVVAVLFGPLRAWLQQRVHRLVYGSRAEPYAAMAALSRRLAESTPSSDVPRLLVETVRTSLRLPWAAVCVGDGHGFPVAAESGTSPARRLSLPVLDRGEQVGLLLVGYDDRRPLSATDRGLLADLATHVGSAVHAVQLTEGLRHSAEDLQTARERLVLAREEERRRIRRDLHDGLAPTLASAGLQLATAAELRGRDPEGSDRLLTGVEGRLRAAVADIRAMVDELRPPALDELGLVRAVRDRVDELAAALPGTVDVTEPLPTLPAAVEVAAYRICQEALMNALRHSRASRLRVTLSAGTWLELSVEDDGVGIGERRPGGVGLGSMAERARELGGECVVEPGCWDGTRRGTRVRARMPLHSGQARA